MSVMHYLLDKGVGNRVLCGRREHNCASTDIREVTCRKCTNLLTSIKSPLEPSPSLLCKLGSIAVHAEEMLSPIGHAFDKSALESLLQDVEVQLWLKRMDFLALLPKKR